VNRRLVLAGTIGIWAVVAAARSAIGALGADYWDPVSLLDYASIWTYSASLGMTALVVLQAAWLARSDPSSVNAGIAAGTGFATAGVANGLEDGLDMSWFGIVYVVGVLVGMFGGLVFAAALRAAGARLLAWLSVLLLVPFLFLESWIGVLVVLPAPWMAWRIARTPVQLLVRAAPVALA
jgi:hypothetical protein